MTDLERFIISAKAACYVGGGTKITPCRPGAHDLAHDAGDWRYLDSYFGGTDFIGQETVWHRGKPVWAMNYYGYILQPEKIDADQTGAVIKAALSALYAESRFLGGFEFTAHGLQYVDENTGVVNHFHGIETVSRGPQTVYRLDYHGGLIRD